MRPPEAKRRSSPGAASGSASTGRPTWAANAWPSKVRNPSEKSLRRPVRSVSRPPTAATSSAASDRAETSSRGASGSTERVVVDEEDHRGARRLETEPAAGREADVSRRRDPAHGGMPAEDLVLGSAGGVVDEQDLERQALAGRGLESRERLEQMFEPAVVDDDGGRLGCLGDLHCGEDYRLAKDPREEGAASPIRRARRRQRKPGRIHARVPRPRAQRRRHAAPRARRGERPRGVPHAFPPRGVEEQPRDRCGQSARRRGRTRSPRRPRRARARARRPRRPRKAPRPRPASSSRVRYASSVSRPSEAIETARSEAA